MHTKRSMAKRKVTRAARSGDIAKGTVAVAKVAAKVQ
jgi:hypothetical protein